MKPAYPRPFSPASLVWMGSEDITLPPFWLGLLRLAVKVAIVLALAWGIHMLMDWATTRAAAFGNEKLMVGVFATLLLAYALLIAVPFMPGIEVGVALLLIQGASIAPFVYLATVCGLMTAFLVGYLVPLPWLHWVCRGLGLRKACSLIDAIATMPLEDRLAKQA